MSLHSVCKAKRGQSKQAQAFEPKTQDEISTMRWYARYSEKDAEVVEVEVEFEGS